MGTKGAVLCSTDSDVSGSVSATRSLLAAEGLLRKEQDMKRKQIGENTGGQHYGLPFLAGTLAGLIATVPMTIVMLAAQRIIPRWQQYALPPERLTDKVTRRIELRKQMDKPQLLAASLVSHFGFGAAAGGIYGLLSRIVPLPSVLKGIIFGIVVWFAVYLGWLPLLGMEDAATNELIHRNALMIVAHVVWGAGTGMVTTWLERLLHTANLFA